MTAPSELGPGTFWPAVEQCSGRALQSGALVPVSTNPAFVPDHGVDFVVRVSDNLLRKRKAPANYQRSGDHDPFLPPDPALTIGTLPPHHVAVLNKFNVLGNHVLIVTSGFAHQASSLTADDFSAVATGLNGRSLAFYNAGQVAGASQKHKHFQLVPLPLDPRPGKDDGDIPTAVLLEGAASGIDTVEGLGFRHAFIRLETGSANALDFGRTCREAYDHALRELGLADPNVNPETHLPPYNLLLTDGWMLVVPRRVEHFQDISVNGLGYAGSLFVSSSDRLDRVRDAGPMAILKAVSMPLT